MKWKPIESAPKDGTTILLYYPNEENAVTSGWWYEEYEGDEYKYGYWKVASLPSHGCGCENSEPTHWMELPDIPSLPIGPIGQNYPIFPIKDETCT